MQTVINILKNINFGPKSFTLAIFLVMAFIFTLCKVDFTQPKFFLPEINNNANKTEYI